ncbi:Streptogramin lyase [Actinopolyspora xinjiangensis]|uniref:Streptogramin lyase n=1 Tax=Actinopolyspora xinjiangensis TaxID=405564 RepID=A0A1H0QE78_9ACTN|nr:hypothetical protein [Actinopolyspora xinjiangensis]SDP15355.1 Streptogramin lyase [Actinopolyspora xinjiangensis]
MATNRTDGGGPNPGAERPKPVRLNEPSPLRGANGIAFGPDGTLHVAQFLTGRISAVDTTSGEVGVVVPPGSPVLTPDDIAFTPDGTMYVADVAPGRVWRRSPDEEIHLVTDALVAPNGITCLGDRIFVNEMRDGGGLFELFPGGGEPVPLTEGLAHGNAMQFGPDGLLYYPHMMTSEVRRIPPEGGEPELVASGMPVPVAVRFDLAGKLFVLSCDPAGTITRVDRVTGRTSSFATGVPGLDNAAFDADNRMFVSSFVRGSITELGERGSARTVVPAGLNGPFGTTVDPTGRVYVADHFGLSGLSESGGLDQVDVVGGTLPSLPRNVVATGEVLQLATAGGELHAYDPVRGTSRRRVAGLGELVGMAVDPGGRVVLAAPGSGRVLSVDETDAVRVLAEGLEHPVGVALDEDGRCYVSDDRLGRVLRLDAEPVVVLDGLDAPQGIAVSGGELFVVEAGHRRLRRFDPETGWSSTEVADLAVETLPGVDGTGPDGSGRPSPFADLVVSGDGSLLLAANGEGSVLSLRIRAEGTG